MTARLTTNLVLGVALSAVAAGCTVHTYSARPEYPSTAFASQPTRHEASYRSDRRSRERDADRPETYQPTYRPSAQHSSNARTDKEHTTHVATRDTTHVATRDTKGSSASHGGGSSNAQKPRVEKDEPVVLMPAKPEKAKTKRGGAQPFAERLKKLVDKKNQEVAQQEKQRRARMRALGEAAVKND